ncbi:hypothetical protein CLIB1423_25S01288 [[Candida] railenensis]|uniref:PWWP domain-containing protein n=1 Tax=[Candida] railenensis TaxID=45579 RepID=A0A9P0W176_9ASCO|nr:hypothetical protein CLIB1423_25S01288 [[Candida] railenensis]
MSDSTYTPKSIVLAKVKGYPPWPAMVLDESLLPEHILIKKPKTVKQPKASSKNTKKVEILPVRFFSDDTYIWIKDSDVKDLKEDTIKGFLEKEGAKRKNDNLLKVAYELANSPPDMELFIKFGSKGEPEPEPEPEPELELEESEAETKEPPKKKQAKSRAKPGPKASSSKASSSKAASSKAASSKAASTKAASSKATSSKAASSKAAASKAAPKPAPKPKVVDPYEGYDSDWGLNENDGGEDDDENYIFSNKKEQHEFETKFPSSQAITEHHRKVTEQIQKIRDNLSKLLLIEESVNEQSILKELGKLKSMKLPSSLIKATQLNKLLIVVLRRPSDAFPFKSIRNEISGLLKKWLDLEILPNDSEDFKLPENGSPSEPVSRNSVVPESAATIENGN